MLWLLPSLLIEPGIRRASESLLVGLVNASRLVLQVGVSQFFDMTELVPVSSEWSLIITTSSALS